MSSITIDGVTVHGDRDRIATVYEEVAAAIERGNHVTINLAVKSTDLISVHAFRITPHSHLSAVLEYTPVDEYFHSEDGTVVHVK